MKHAGEKCLLDGNEVEQGRKEKDKRCGGDERQETGDVQKQLEAEVVTEAG